MDRRPILLSLYSLCTAGDLNTPNRSFDYNVESNLDLQYGMALVTGKQPVPGDWGVAGNGGQCLTDDGASLYREL